MKTSSSAPFPRREDLIEKAASDWLARCDRGFTADEATAFLVWKAADPRHAIEFDRIASTWSVLDTADEVPQIMALSSKMDEVFERRAARRRRMPWLLGCAALAAAVVVGLRVPRALPTEPASTVIANTCRVIPSSARSVALPDGSKVDLNADTVLDPMFTADERRVRLLRGEAHFAVAKDPARPFVVEVGNVTFCAVGTAFNVRVDPAAVQLLVTEGKVRVEPAGAEPTAAVSPLVVAGQRLVVEAGEHAAPMATLQPETVTPQELELTLAWKESLLVFDRTPLAEAVAAFNRFNSHQLVVADPALAARKLGGTFQASNIEAFVVLLENGFDVRVDRQTDGKTILRERN